MLTRTALRTALKVPEPVVRAVMDGKHLLLVARVRELDPTREARFVTRLQEFFLYPVPDPAARHALRAEFHSYLDGPPLRDGSAVTVTGRALVTDPLMFVDGVSLAGLEPFHVWTTEHLRQQVAWDPHDPPFLLLCKVQRVDPPFRVAAEEVDRQPGRWACLPADLPPASFESVIPHADYLKAALEAKRALAEAQKNPAREPAPDPAAPQPAGA